MRTIDIIRALCTKNNTSIKTLEKELGFSNGSLAKAATIKDDRLQKIAEYFNVSIDYLTTGKEPTAGPLYTKENAVFLSDVAMKAKDKDFVNRMMKYMELMEADRKSVDDMIDFLHAKKKGEA